MSATKVRIDGDFVVFDVIVYNETAATYFQYDIPVSDLQKTTSVAKWKKHLSEKRWATTEIIDAFEAMVQTYWRNR